MEAMSKRMKFSMRIENLTQQVSEGRPGTMRGGQECLVSVLPQVNFGGVAYQHCERAKKT